MLTNFKMYLSEFVITCVITIIWSRIIYSSALPATKRMIYYQQPMPFYNGPQRMMYIQYVQPSRMFGRSMQAAEALVAGDRVATSTYLKDCDHIETDVAAVADPTTITNNPIIQSPPYYMNIVRDSSLDVYNTAQSIAESYPAGNVPLIDGIPLDVDVVPEENEVSVYESEEPSKKIPHDYNLDHTDVTESNVDSATVSDEQTTDVRQQQSPTQETLVDTQLSTLETTTRTNAHGLITPLNDAKTTSFSAETNLMTETESMTIKYNNDDGLTLPSKIGNTSFQHPVTGPQQTYLPATSKINMKSDATIKSKENDETITINNKSLPGSIARRVAKKKVFVELDSTHRIENDLQAPAITKVKNHPIESDVDVDADKDVDDDNDDDEAEEDEEEEDEEILGTAKVPVVPKKINRQSTRTHQVSTKSFKANQDTKPSRPNPPNGGPFFPVEFGGTGGGAIAIANSYSTGESGTASSHAIAYGTPDAIRSRIHARPSKLY